MSNWLVPLAIGSPIGAAIAVSPALLRRRFVQRARDRLAATGLRPGLRVHVAIRQESDLEWALLTVHVSNRTKDIWWLQQIDFPGGNVRAVLEVDPSLARSTAGPAVVMNRPLPRGGPVFPDRSIHPDEASSAHFTGLADGTYEYVHLHSPSERGPVAVEITLRRMGGKGRAIILNAVRPIVREHNPD